MDFGIAMATSADAWKLVERAEALGFSHAWFYDTQMLSADCFVAMGAAAIKTDRIRLGTGVLIPSNRIAPLTAELIRDTSFTATAPELKARIGALKDAGYTQLTIQIGPGQEDAIEDWGRIRNALA